MEQLGYNHLIEFFFIEVSKALFQRIDIRDMSAVFFHVFKE
jgi:hypothetical protein